MKQNPKSSPKGILIMMLTVLICRSADVFSNFDFRLALLDPTTNGFIITGGATSDMIVSSINTAGDIDKDGYSDIIIGVSSRSSNKGAAYVIYGRKESSFSDIDLSSITLDPRTTGFMITGNAAGDAFGYSVATAGDINKDGYDDIIIGAYSKKEVYVIYGGPKSSRSNLDLSTTTLDPLTTGFVIKNASGYLVKTAGDVNNDGYDDLMMGAGGKVVVIYGGPKSSMTNMDLSATTLDPLTTGFAVIKAETYDAFGTSMNTAGDINKDGYDDIIIGASGSTTTSKGAAYVIYGGPKSSMSNIDLSTTTLDPLMTGFKITGNQGLGFSVDTAGDFNKDGYSDIIIGGIGDSNQKGAAYVIYGGPKSSMSHWDFSSGSTLDPLTTGFVVSGNADNNYLGSSVSTAGDINNDGYNDIIAGAQGWSMSKGAAYVIYGREKSSMSNIDLMTTELDPAKTGLVITGGTYYAKLGVSVSTAGDINKDGSSDIIIREGGSEKIYVFFAVCFPCGPCPANCNQCSSSSTCLECRSSFLLYQSQCFASCPPATFQSDNLCKECPLYCSSCTSQESCPVCQEGYTLSNSACVLSDSSATSQSQEKASQAIAAGVRGIGSVICVASATFPLTAMVSKIVQNTRYLNLSVSTDLSEIYKTWDTDMISWDVPNVFSNQDQFKSTPLMFVRYELDSPFLENFWPTLMNLGIGLATFVTCYVLKILFEKSKYEGSKIYSIILKLIAGSFNFTLVQVYGCLDDILFYLVLDAKTNPFNTFFAWASIICAAVFMALGCLLVLFNLWTVYKYQTIKNQGLAIKNMTGLETFNERNKYWELFYSDFSDEDSLSQSFFAILLIRNTLSSLITTVFYDYPLMQTAYLIMLDGAIILFLFFKKPFTALQGKLCQYYYEIITLLVHICAFILSFQDTFQKPSDTVKKIFSTGIIYLNTALVSGALGFMFIEIYEAIRYKTKKPKFKQSENIVAQAATEEISNLNDQSNTLASSPSWVRNEQAAPFENFYLIPGVDNNKTISVNLEPSQGLDPSLNHTHHIFLSGRIPGNRINEQDGQRRKNIFKPHQRNRSINSEQFDDS